MRLALLAVLALAAPSAAHDYKAGALLIDHLVIRIASPVSKTGAGFMTITNKSTRDDRLLSVTTTASTRADLHGTFAQGNVMQMRAQSGGVPIPAGGTVRFAPGGLHVMFIGLKASLPIGQSIKARLTFANAGRIDVEFKAEAAASHQSNRHH
jgi:copper(I)-binding protein